MGLSSTHMREEKVESPQYSKLGVKIAITKQ